MQITTENGKVYIETEYTTGNKAWAAKIIGLDPKFKFSREFLNGTRKGLKLTQVEEGDIFEEVVFSHSGKNRNTNFYSVQNSKLVPMSEREVILYFS